jgi:hypothetical protein
VHTTFVSRANIHHAQFWFLHYFLLCTIFVSHADILRAFHSTHCTMPNFSMLPLHTNTLHAPLTKLSHNIHPHCACTNDNPLCSANTAHTTHSIIICVHTAHTLICVCTPCNTKFSVCTCTPTFFHATPNFSTRIYTPTFFRGLPNFSTRTPIFFYMAPKFSARTRTTNFSVRHQNLALAPAGQYFSTQCQNLACAPAHQYFLYHNPFTMHHAFLVCPLVHIHFMRINSS